MTTEIYADARFLEHDPGPGHPESPARLRAILDALTSASIPGVKMVPAREAHDEELLRVHEAWHVDRMRAFDGLDVPLDEDTHMSPGSHLAARLAAGASAQAVMTVWNREAENAFVLARPPGHHAEPARAMGFCVFNNVAVAAETALQLGARRVLIVDWDVHHGNGTQRAFAHRRDVLFLSAHQHPLYPGSGGIEELGTGEGAGFTANCPLPAGQTDADYGAVFNDLFLPIADAFAPDLVLVSAGFDAHAADPLGGMKLTERGFAAMTSSLMALAEAHAKGRLVLLLEGGYDLRALGSSVASCVSVLARREAESFPSGAALAAGTLARCRETLKPYWRLP